MEDDFSGFTIGIAGLGLIGGSLALAFKKAGFTVYGFDIDPETVRQALSRKAVDRASTAPDAVLDANFVFAALYPNAIIEFIRQNALRLRKSSIVVDCCGIKGEIFKQAAPIAQRAGFTYIGGHPMAGTEHDGFSAAKEDLFKGASFILTPPESVGNVAIEKVKRLVMAAGFGRVVVTTPEIHDRMIAFTSQLPHIIACSYVSSPSCPKHVGYSAGSFRDVSRVAHINPQMWADLFLGNREALCTEIDILFQNLSNLRSAIAADDREALVRLLSQARERKDEADKNG